MTAQIPAQDPGLASGFFSQTGNRIARALRDLTGAARIAITRTIRPGLPDDDLNWIRTRIDACLAARGGEVSARGIAAEIGRYYLMLNDTGRQRFLNLLAVQYGVDHAAVLALAADLGNAQGNALIQAEEALRDLLESPRLRLLKRFNGIAGGVKFLVDLRADLLRLARTDATLAPLGRELRILLASWFDAGFLDLRTITWDSPAALLEKLIAYEAVHEIRSWSDLKNRLDSDRRCFAFFHPAMPGEPLIFVEVALENGMAANVQKLLDETSPSRNAEDADTAIFYSISNAQAGLAGVSFGEFLIKRVVAELQGEFPKLKTFATLSPIPGFAAWLGNTCASGAIAMLLPVAETLQMNALAGTDKPESALQILLGDPQWPDDPRKSMALRAPLMRLCRHYLFHARTDNGRALDPVAHFHLSNGARLERINWQGDRSGKGLAQSHGMMVNYLYKLGDVEKNFERYTGGNIAASPTIRDLS
jgi:malonyl-CoA decarboxylase